MISTLRILAWRALQCAKLVLRDKCPVLNARTANSGVTQEKKQSAIQKYLWSRQSITVQKTILGGSRGSNQTGSAVPREADVSGVLISQRPVANLFGRVGPLLSGAIRRLSTQRSSQSSYPVFIRNSAPLFALVGVTLVATEDELTGKARSEVKQRGFVTREEELEAICGSIRNAIYKSGWLESLQCDMPAKKRAPEGDSAAPPPQYSLQDLDIGGVLDKGCNAAVYAARWKDDSDDEPEAGPSTAHLDNPRPAMSPQAASQVNLPLYQSSGSFLRATPFHYSNLNLHSESLLDETIARTVSVEALFDSRPPQNDHTEEPDLSSLSFVAPTVSGQLAEAAQQSGSPAAAALTLSAGQFGRPGVVRPKKVSFNVPSNVDSNGNGRLSPLRDEEPPEQSGVPSSKYPLAVKLVFNYEAASNAPAILSALYRELLPARSMQVHAPSYTMLEVLQAVVPYHPNLVDMPCAFVDRVPLLEGGLQLYPNALPARLNPLGVGRNMSLFCVMRRYDLTLARYLLLHPRPSCRTALLLLTQLLEALHHLHLHHIAHRDLKPDNILLLVDEGLETPWLVVTDFGCSLAASSESGLRVPFVSREAEPRQGNAALMAPEVKSARPGLLQSVDFSKCDLWAAGTLAYQFFGLPNPFLCAGENGSPRLDSMSYSERDLPDLRDTDAPLTVRRLVADLLRRRPAQRPSASVAATLSQLCLWGPSEWLQRHSAARPQREQVMEWLLTLTAKVLFENRAVSAATEYRLVSTFLSRVRFSDVIRAINWNSAF